MKARAIIMVLDNRCTLGISTRGITIEGEDHQAICAEARRWAMRRKNRVTNGFTLVIEGEAETVRLQNIPL